ncbi:MAG: hypothetical protein EBZ49_14645 [Proteobacteria bacterium]|nr:hypothetical protein [Pseudomonadota bacterium]
MSNEVKGTVAPIAPEQQEPIVEQQPQQPDQSAERFAQLARKEKALRAQARQLQEQQKAWQEQQAKSQSSWKDQVKNDPLSVLAEAGLTHDQIAEMLLNSRPDDMEMRRVKAELQALKNAQQEQFSKIQDAQKAAYEQAVKQVSREVNMLVDGNEAYETIKATKSQTAVVELIKQTYDEDGVLLSAEEAADMVEEYLTDEALTLAKLKKVQSKLAPPEAAQSGDEVQQNQKPLIQTKTLTNTVTTASKPMTKADRRARAIAAFKGELK